MHQRTLPCREPAFLQELDRVKDNLLQLLDMDDVRPALRRKPPDAPGDAVDLRLVIIAVALGCWLVSQSQ